MAPTSSRRPTRPLNHSIQAALFVLTLAAMIFLSWHRR